MNMYLRKWESFDVEKIAKSLFVIGELSGECFSCHKVGIAIGSRGCPECKQEFLYIGFRRRIDSSSLQRFVSKYPHSTFIDFDDFKKATGKKDARKLLDM